MIQNSRTQSNQDVPPSLALILLGLVVGVYLYKNAPTTFFHYSKELEKYIGSHFEIIGAVLFSLTINFIWIYSFIVRAVGFQKQGSRLEVMSGKKQKTRDASPISILISLGLGVVSFSLMFLLRFPDEGQIKLLVPDIEVKRFIVLAIRGTFSCNMLVLSLFLARFSFLRRFLRIWGGALPTFPKPKDAIVLGSINEPNDESIAESNCDDDRSCLPKWVILPRRALFGNILITGSIGGGKTQGTILPYFDQILSNFVIRPSILLIDPKGTFVPKALKIIAQHKKLDHVLHLKLGGIVTFNPIYQKHGLKGSKFLETAQMIKAAASNARIQSSIDSDFWEISAFNLTKNALIFCYAVYDYCTLEDLYRTMVEANDKDFKSTLLACLQSESFDKEEKFNIKCAIQYFESEYKQLDSKIRTSILATATSFLNQFQEYQANQIFCPKKELLTIPSIDEVIDEGKILIFDVKNPALARSMGTFVKLLYEQSVLNRMTDPERNLDRCSVLIVDEYQDVVSTGAGGTIGDVGFLAKARESNSISIMASQSLISIENTIGREKAAQELIQNFRTRLSAHSGDLKTIRSFQELAGQEERQRTSHSFSENSHHPSRNLILGGFEAKDTNISESLSTSEHKEDIITGKEFSRLKTFECFALIYNGIETECKKLFLKPYFLTKKNLSHKKVLAQLKDVVTMVIAVIFLSHFSFAFPNVCTVVKGAPFHSCLSLSIGGCMCGWPTPRPCAQFSYYVPKTFIEVMPNSKDSYFGKLPGAAIQLATLGSMRIPFGAESDDDTHTFQSHVVAVPFTQIPFSALPCAEFEAEKLCFEGMSEHLGSNWSTGSADSLQPSFLAWSLSPKACLIKGAINSATGGTDFSLAGGNPICSYPIAWLPKYPPSSHSACNGWGTFYPRSGVYNGPSQTAGALMIASRMKSISSEVFLSTPSSSDEIWQMISPQISSCFREGQNVGFLETIKNVREVGRLSNRVFSGYLFVVWSKVSCCRDLVEIPTTYIAIEAMKLACEGLGGL